MKRAPVSTTSPSMVRQGRRATSPFGDGYHACRAEAVRILGPACEQYDDGSERGPSDASAVSATVTQVVHSAIPFPHSEVCRPSDDVLAPIASRCADHRARPVTNSKARACRSRAAWSGRLNDFVRSVDRSCQSDRGDMFTWHGNGLFAAEQLEQNNHPICCNGRNDTAHTLQRPI